MPASNTSSTTSMVAKYPAMPSHFCIYVAMLDRPVLDELKPDHRSKVLKRLSTDVPLSITGPLIEEESYWERCCRARWDLCNTAEHGGSWKCMYFERNAQEAIEKFVPETSDLAKLEELLRLSSPYVRCLIIRQLLPPPQEKLPNMDDEDVEVCVAL